MNLKQAHYFDRNVSPFCLTFPGERYIQAAGVILAANERLENELHENREENSGRLRLGTGVQQAIQVLPWFTALFPHVTLEVTKRGSAHLEELVLQGQIDLALAALESVSPKLTYKLIEEECLCGT